MSHYLIYLLPNTAATGGAQRIIYLECVGAVMCLCALLSVEVRKVNKLEHSLQKHFIETHVHLLQREAKVPKEGDRLVCRNKGAYVKDEKKKRESKCVRVW